MRTIIARLPARAIPARLVLLPLLVALLVIPLLVARPSQRFLSRTAQDVSQGAQTTFGRMRYRVEPVVITGGIIVSRNRNTIAGAAGGCLAGAALGAASAAVVVGLATGGIGLAALPAGAALGCALVGSGGAAIGHPLDTWSLSE